jgi:ParB-like chromosome segregation protein Spo0J
MNSPNLPHKVIKTALIRKSKQHWDREITPADLEDLGGSIEDEGLLHPIVVRKVGKMYEYLAGERRFKVYRKRGERDISCTVVPECDDIKARKISLEENLKTKKPSSTEWAAGVRELHDIVRAQIIKTQSQEATEETPEPSRRRKASRGRPENADEKAVHVVAKKVGVHPNTVKNVLNQEKLISTAKHALEQGKITTQQANALSRMSKEDQRLQLSQMVQETRGQTQNRLTAERIQTAEPDKAIREAVRAHGRLMGQCEKLYEEVNTFYNSLTDQICKALYRESRDDLVKLHKATAQLLHEIESAEESS